MSHYSIDVSRSYKELIYALMNLKELYEFDAVYAANQCGTDWAEQVLRYIAYFKDNNSLDEFIRDSILKEQIDIGYSKENWNTCAYQFFRP